jgi:formylglycine-generating enzyme required for sulfatase activity
MTRGLFIPACFFLSAALLPAKADPQIDFKRDIAPILERSCVRCHHAGTGSSNLHLTSRAELLKGRTVEPGKPDSSLFYQVLVGGSMPPGKRLSAGEMTAIHDWIKQGVRWPDGVTLTIPPEQPVAPPAASSSADAAELANVREIRDRIVARERQNPSTMAAYKVTIPNTTVDYQMTPIAAGEFQMGSDEKKDEQPIHQVTVGAFWMQTHEVTWDEYRLFMFANQAGETTHKDNLVDAISRPTRPYVEMSFGMGINGFPAISMTQHAANKYAEWLSAKTGDFYRLPTEAEWEYACRAGTAPPTPLSDSAWDAADSNGTYHKVATKKPNAWGLFDMLGNVMEWTLDQYAPYPSTPQINPWVKPTKPYPIAVRGGSWNDPPPMLTCEARVGSDASWKQQDPQLPKSIWYETDAQWLGFRLVRPAKVPPADDMYHAWNNGVEHDEQ